MRWKQIDTMTCSIARTLSVVGDHWTMLIIRDVFLGIRRFEAIQQDLQLTPHRLSHREQSPYQRKLASERRNKIQWQISRDLCDTSALSDALRQLRIELDSAVGAGDAGREGIFTPSAADVGRYATDAI
jgi:hypothetical protein